MNSTIQYCSDLHLEFSDNRAYIKNNPIIAKCDILLLAGDIIPFSMLDKFDWFFDEISGQFETVYWIAGNHEYYGADIKERSGSFFEPIRENVFLVNNFSVEVGSTTIILSTLWSKISEVNKLSIQYGMNDFRHIRFGSRIFNPTDCNTLFNENLAFLEEELLKIKKNQKVVVVTHHVPTYYNYPEKYKHSVLNDAFATELDSFMRRFSIDYWIYGHSHSNTPDFKLGNTVLTNNQLGYVGYNEHLNYKDCKELEL